MGEEAVLRTGSGSGPAHRLAAGPEENGGPRLNRVRMWLMGLYKCGRPGAHLPGLGVKRLWRRGLGFLGLLWWRGQHAGQPQGTGVRKVHQWVDPVSGGIAGVSGGSYVATHSPLPDACPAHLTSSRNLSSSKKDTSEYLSRKAEACEGWPGVQGCPGEAQEGHSPPLHRRLRRPRDFCQNSMQVHSLGLLFHHVLRHEVCRPHRQVQGHGGDG